MLTHTDRVQKIAEKLRSYVLVSDWPTVVFPRIGAVKVHVVSQEASKAYGWNEVWARIDNCEFRGTAEKVAEELCLRLRAPSKAVGEAAEFIIHKHVESFDGLRAEEMAAAFNMDEDLVFKALDFLAEQGRAENRGDLGWYKR